MYATNSYSIAQRSLTNPGAIDLKPQTLILKQFILHSYQHNNTVYMHLFAVVSWLKDHHARYYIHCKPFELWWKDLFDSHLDDINY